MEDRKEELAAAITREEGKTISEARGETQRAINVVEFCAGESRRMTGETIPSELPANFAYTIKEPHGVVACITPWNFPIAIPAWKIAPALVAGNTVVFKPSEETPAVGQRGIQWFNQDAFASPARFTYGNAARTVMLGPGLVNFDTAITKNWRFLERYRLQFRWEAFNAFNTPSFGAPGSNLGAGGFGIAGAGASDREMQFALKLYF
jgi:hypothetical protein